MPTDAPRADAMSEAELAELESLEKAATAAPWLAQILRSSIEVQFNGRPSIVHWTGFDDSDRHWVEHAFNAQLIAAARNALPRLLASARRALELEQREQRVAGLVSKWRAAAGAGPGESGMTGVLLLCAGELAAVLEGKANG